MLINEFLILILILNMLSSDSFFLVENFRYVPCYAAGSQLANTLQH